MALLGFQTQQPWPCPLKKDYDNLRLKLCKGLKKTTRTDPRMVEKVDERKVITRHWNVWIFNRWEIDFKIHLKVLHASQHISISRAQGSARATILCSTCAQLSPYNLGSPQESEIFWILFLSRPPPLPYSKHSIHLPYIFNPAISCRT